MQDFYSRVLGFPITDEGLLGTQRLRGYRSNRSCNSYTNFQGAAFLWYVMEVQEAFDYLVQRGVYAGLQLAAFWERGTVSPNPGRDLWKNFRTSSGLGRDCFSTPSSVA